MDEDKIASLQKSIFVFKFDYEKVMDLQAGDFIRSPSFVIGGFNWAIRLYARVNKRIDGSDVNKRTYELLLTLLTKASKIRVEFCLDILGECNVIKTTTGIKISNFMYKGYGRGERMISPSTILGASHTDFVTKRDCFYVRCTIESCIPKRERFKDDGLSEHLLKLLDDKKGCDVNFMVEGQLFSAHRPILASRTRTFDAMLFGPMFRRSDNYIEIKDMRADVFEVLLHFIYSDELSTEDYIGDVLVAADRYNLDKLKAVCEEKLCEDLCVENVLETLLMADRHNCASLKEECLNFASKMENFTNLAFTKEFVEIANYPNLFSELQEMVVKRKRID